MGIYTEYLDSGMSAMDMLAERKRLLNKLSSLRGGRDVLVYAANHNAKNAPIALSYDDLLPFNDQLSNLNGNELDLIIETPGGSGEVAEDMVRRLRERYEKIAVIIPGWAKSAGTIIALAGDEILMGEMSSLGPIDAQLQWQGKVFSAHAFLEGLAKIKEEVDEKKELNRAYIPILQAISPGEIQSAENAMNFAKRLVTDSLLKYKFKYWEKHSDGRPVTTEEKADRASEIADMLGNHGAWLTHGRSIKLKDLEGMGLKITNYSDNEELADTIGRYYTLLQMTFDTGIYKLFETPESQIYRAIGPREIKPIKIPKGAEKAGSAVAEIICGQCNEKLLIQGDFAPNQTLQEGAIRFPDDNKIKCSKCGNLIDVNGLRKQLELAMKKPIIKREKEEADGSK